MSRANGGPAFPQPEPIANEFHAGYGLDRGMTLRDYFAAKCITPMLHGAQIPPGYDASEDFQKVAALAYVMADAMLKERDK